MLHALPPLDRPTLLDLNGFAARHSWFVELNKAISLVFSPTSFRVIAVVLSLWLLYRKQPRLAGWLAFTVLGGSLLTLALKEAVGRHRPVPPHPVATAAGQSFPSGHAFTAVVGVGALLILAWPLLRHRGRVIAVVAGTLIVLVTGFSRLALSVHYLSDVTAGYVIGLAWLGLCFAAFRPWKSGPAGKSAAQPTEPGVSG